MGVIFIGISTHIYYSGSDALTKIGTDGLYSFWSLYNYLYFSQSEGLKIKAGTTISSPNGEYSLTVNDQGISISGEAGTNASNNTVDFTVAGTRVNISTGEKLSAAFGKIAKWFTDLKTVAFTGSYNDLSNTPASLPANGGHADSATKDANGNVITTTYATNADIASQKFLKADGSVQMSEGAAFNLSGLPSRGTGGLMSFFGNTEKNPDGTLRYGISFTNDNPTDGEPGAHISSYNGIRIVAGLNEWRNWIKVPPNGNIQHRLGDGRVVPMLDGANFIAGIDYVDPEGLAEALPKVYVDEIPSNAKDGDIVIITTG